MTMGASDDLVGLDTAAHCEAVAGKAFSRSRDRFETVLAWLDGQEAGARGAAYVAFAEPGDDPSAAHPGCGTVDALAAGQATKKRARNHRQRYQHREAQDGQDGGGGAGPGHGALSQPERESERVARRGGVAA